MGHDRLCYLIMLLLLDMTMELACIWTKCVWGSQTTLFLLFMNSCCNNYVNYLWNVCNMWLVMLNHCDLGCMQVGLKSFVVSVDYRVYMGSSMTVWSLRWLLSYLCSYKLVGSITPCTSLINRLLPCENPAYTGVLKVQNRNKNQSLNFSHTDALFPCIISINDSEGTSSFIYNLQKQKINYL